MSTLGSRIRSERKRKNLSQEALADLTGINRVTITQLEGDKTTIRGENLLRLASAFGVRTEWLLWNKPPKFPDDLSNDLSPDEAALLRKYHGMNERQKSTLRAVADGMLPE